MPEPASAPFIALARLLRPQGRRGELLADLLTDFPQQFDSPAGLFLVPRALPAPPPGASRIVIEERWLPTGKNAGRIVLKLAGCDSITAAELLAGHTLMLPASERPALDPDTFYVSDLVGSTLFNGDTLVGTVIDVDFATTPDGRTRLPDAAPLLAVQRKSGEDPILVPFVRAQLLTVDPETHRIVMQLPEGLLDADLPATGDPAPTDVSE